MVLAPEWQSWVANNLVQGAAPKDVIAALEQAEVPSDVARTAVMALAASPLLSIARQHAQESAALESVHRLRRKSRAIRGPDTTPTEREDIRPEEFLSDFYAENRPLVVRGFASDWPAVRKWSPEYFREHFGDSEVSITDGRESDPHYDRNQEQHRRTTCMRDLVQRIESTDTSNDFYMVARDRAFWKPDMAPLLDDIPTDHGLLDPEKKRQSTVLWFGPKGTLTPLHHDNTNILFVQVYGRKTIHLVAPDETALWGMANGIYATGVDPVSPPHELQDVSFQKVELHPGDMLFLPVGWWHHVRAESVSISLAANGFPVENSFPWYHPAPRRD